VVLWVQLSSHAPFCGDPFHPDKFGVAVISPPLDEAGNSVRAQKAIADISNSLRGNPLAPSRR